MYEENSKYCKMSSAISKIIELAYNNKDKINSIIITRENGSNC